MCRWRAPRRGSSWRKKRTNAIPYFQLYPTWNSPAAIAEPKLDEMTRRGFSPEYVYRETKRSVASAADKTKLYSGIGFNIPGQPRTTDPENVYKAVHRAFDAGAAGVVISREYEETACELKGCR